MGYGMCCERRAIKVVYACVWRKQARSDGGGRWPGQFLAPVCPSQLVKGQGAVLVCRATIETYNHSNGHFETAASIIFEHVYAQVKVVCVGII